MRIIVFYIVILSSTFLGFCDNSLKRESNETSVSEEKINRKYNITALFYGENFKYGDNDEFSAKIIRYIVFRNNQTGEEVKYMPTGQIPAGDFYFTGIWSPDEEYLILPIGTFEGFGIFKAKNVLESIKSNKFSDAIKVGGSTGGFFAHDFEKWEDDSTFSFRAGLEGDMFAFKYSLAKSELYCYRTGCEENEIGINDNGKINPIKKGDIEPIQVH